MAERPTADRNFGGRNRKGSAVSDDAVSAWFLREIMPFEANLMHYLQHNWRNASDIPDLRQEVYVRVLEAAQERIPDNPKHFLLVCARNLLIDRMRRSQVVPMDNFADMEVLGLAAEAPEPEREVIDRDELKRVEAALKQLPVRTREAIALAYFEGLSRTEIARRMGVSHQAASQFVARGALILGNILFNNPKNMDSGT